MAFKLSFEGMDQCMQRLRSLDANIKQVGEDALKETHDIVTDKARSAIGPHHRTGKTEKSLYENAAVNWQRSVGSVKVGFDCSGDGMPSVFLTWGTPRHMGANQYGSHGKSVGGTAQDKNLYNAFWGSSTKREVIEKQSEIFYDAIRKSGG